jgi:hypothetical protein
LHSHAGCPAPLTPSVRRLYGNHLGSKSSLEVPSVAAAQALAPLITVLGDVGTGAGHYVIPLAPPSPNQACRANSRLRFQFIHRVSGLRESQVGCGSPATFGVTLPDPLHLEQWTHVPLCGGNVPRENHRPLPLHAGHRRTKRVEPTAGSLVFEYFLHIVTSLVFAAVAHPRRSAAYAR